MLRVSVLDCLVPAGAAAMKVLVIGGLAAASAGFSGLEWIALGTVLALAGLYALAVITYESPMGQADRELEGDEGPAGRPDTGHREGTRGPALQEGRCVRVVPKVGRGPCAACARKLEDGRTDGIIRRGIGEGRTDG